MSCKHLSVPKTSTGQMCEDCGFYVFGVAPTTSNTEKELLALMHEYWLSVIPKNPEYQNPENMNQLSFFGFYEWLRKRKGTSA